MFLFNILISLGCIQAVYTQIPIYPLHFRSSLESTLGLGWPQRLRVATGHEALLKLSRAVESQDSCTIRSPQGQTFPATNLPNDRFETWGEGCGVRIKNIVHSDTGRWRLTSARDQHHLTGYIEVHVIDARSSYTASPISLMDGVANAHVDLITLDNYYCMVAQPFAPSSLVAGHCEVTLEKTSRAVQGTWKLLVGLPGQVAELAVDREVAVQTEHLDVGHIHDATDNKLHLYCNIMHSYKDITFCRFQHTAGAAGYNVIDGLSDGHYSYYGEGFVKKQCGITVEQPTARDFTSWRCSVGVQERISDDHVVQSSPLQALISVTAPNVLSVIPERNDVNEERQVFTQLGSTLTLDCQADVSLSYCWFQHPNGSQYTPGLRTEDPDNEQLFWYSGESLQMGDCSISFARADNDSSGPWTCHMGSSVRLGVELTDSINVRVTGPLAANQLAVNATVTGDTTINCHTSGAARSLQYCRFVSPTFLGLNIDASITADNAILGRYYFPPDKSLDRGDCSLTIKSVQPEDDGVWTCAAHIVGHNLESRDYVHIYVSESEQPGRSSVGRTIGLTLGVVVLVAALIGAAIFYRKKLLDVGRGVVSPRTVSMREVARPSVSSGSSGSSGGSDDVMRVNVGP